GLTVRTTSVLDKVQASFKQVVSTTTVKGDPLILLVKNSDASSNGHEKTVDDIIAAVLENGRASAVADERTRERLFSRFIDPCLVEGVPVTIGVAEFYQRAALDSEC